MAKIIALANQKGGVGKTTTTFNLGAKLAQQNQAVLLVDIDPQGNLSSYAGFDPAEDKAPTMSELVSMVHTDGLACKEVQLREDEKMASEAEQIITNAVRHCESEKLDFLPTTIKLTGAETLVINAFCREKILSTILSYVEHAYDYILIDCPPALGTLSINALTACDEVLVPVQAQNFALDGLIQLLDTIRRVRGSSNPNIVINGFLLTMVKHNNMSREVSDALTKQFKEKVYPIVISDSTAAPTSTVEMQSIRGKLGEQYHAVAMELLERSAERE